MREIHDDDTKLGEIICVTERDEQVNPVIEEPFIPGSRSFHLGSSRSPR